jgi:hypothetical protein
VAEFGTTPGAGRLIVYNQASGQLSFDATPAAPGVRWPPRALEVEEIHKFGEALAARESANEVSPWPANFIRLSLICGPRPGEVRTITWARINLPRRRMRVVGKTGEREIHLTDAAAQVHEAKPRVQAVHTCSPAAATGSRSPPSTSSSRPYRTGQGAVDLGPIRLAFWQPDVALKPSRPFRLAEGDLDSLRAILEDDRPTILVAHPPVSGQDQTGNHWFENNTAHATYREELPAIRKVLGEAPCPLVALAGHVHWNSLTIVDAIPHLTLQSLSETCTTGGSPSGCSARLTVEDETLRWGVSGLDAFEVVIPFPRRSRHWTSPLPRFDTVGVRIDAGSARFAPRREVGPVDQGAGGQVVADERDACGRPRPRRGPG